MSRVHSQGRQRRKSRTAYMQRPDKRELVGIDIIEMVGKLELEKKR